MNARRTIIPRTILDELTRQHIKNRTLMTNWTRVILARCSRVADGGNIETESWGVGAGEVAVEGGGGAGGGVGMEDGLDAGCVEEGFDCFYGSVSAFLVMKNGGLGCLHERRKGKQTQTSPSFRYQ
jgi:hypothetical protein